PAAQRDGGVEGPRAPGDLRSRGHGYRRLRSARGLVQKRVTPRGEPPPSRGAGAGDPCGAHRRVSAGGAPPADMARCRATRHLVVGTSAVALLFAIVGSWTGRPGSLFKATMLGALVFFTPWAALQQMLFQFYLLGRLRVLIPASPALTLAAMNGVLFGTVHLPDVELTVLTSIGGAVWSWY